MQNKLNMYFHLVHDHEISTKPCSFTPEMMVKCCFQIWERKDTKRISIPLVTVIKRLNNLDYKSSLNTARQNSMGKSELVSLYNNVFYSKKE